NADQLRRRGGHSHDVEFVQLVLGCCRRTSTRTHGCSSLAGGRQQFQGKPLAAVSDGTARSKATAPIERAMKHLATGRSWVAGVVELGGGVLGRHRAGREGRIMGALSPQTK